MTSMDTEDVVESTPKLGNIDQVTMHPLVLLSAADHYHRVARGTRKRVVGVLLGMVSKGVVDCTNSFAVPFEEDSRNPVSFTIRCFCRCSWTLVWLTVKWSSAHLAAYATHFTASHTILSLLWGWCYIGCVLFGSQLFAKHVVHVSQGQCQGASGWFL